MCVCVAHARMRACVRAGNAQHVARSWKKKEISEIPTSDRQIFAQPLCNETHVCGGGTGWLASLPPPHEKEEKNIF
jgi:hypothetical protein